MTGRPPEESHQNKMDIEMYFADLDEPSETQNEIQKMGHKKTDEIAPDPHPGEKDKQQNHIQTVG